MARYVRAVHQAAEAYRRTRRIRLGRRRLGEGRDPGGIQVAGLLGGLLISRSLTGHPEQVRYCVSHAPSVELYALRHVTPGMTVVGAAATSLAG